MDFFSSDLLSPSTILFLLLSIVAFAFFRVLHGRASSKGKKKSGGFVDLMTELVLTSPTNTVTLPALPHGLIVTANPANVEHILKDKFHNYVKGEAFTATLADLLGHGIFNSDGDYWRVQRKIASLEFGTRTTRALVIDNVRSEAATRLLPLLSRAAATGETVDLQDLLDRMAFDNVCKVALDIDPARLAGEEGECGRFGRAFEAVARASIRRFAQPSFVWRLCRLLRVGPEKELRKELAVLNEFAVKLVRERRARRKEEITSQRDLLSRLVALDGDYTDDFLRDMLVSFVLAGRDTTSTGLAWFFWALSAEPEVQRRILDEIRAVRAKHGSSDEVLSMDELRDMDYLHAAVSESLRLYPPVALSTRVSVADDTLPDGTAVKKGRQVMYCMHAMGRLEAIWGPDWREFRPERWLEKGMFKARSSYEFPVFNAGPRLCLGREMAYTQMKAVAAAVVERFELEVSEEWRRETEQITAHRMKYGLPVRVRVRQGAAPLAGA